LLQGVNFDGNSKKVDKGWLANMFKLFQVDAIGKNIGQNEGQHEPNKWWEDIISRIKIDPNLDL